MDQDTGVALLALQVVNRRLRDAQAQLIGLPSECVPWTTKLVALRAHRKLAGTCRDRIVVDGEFARLVVETQRGWLRSFAGLMA